MIYKSFDNQILEVRSDPVWIHLEELLVLPGIVLWAIQQYADDTGFEAILGGTVLTGIRFLAMLLFALCVLLTERHFTLRLLALLGAGAAFVMVLQNMAGDGIRLIQLFLLVLAMRNVSFKRMCRIMFWSCLVLFFLVLFSWWTGLIYEPPMSYESDRLREYLGYIYPSFGPIKFVNIVFAGCYGYTDQSRIRARDGQRRGLPWSVLFFFFAVNAWLYAMTDTNLVFYIVDLFLILYILTVKLDLDLFADRLPARILSVLAFPAMFLLSLWMTVSYDPEIEFWKNLDNFSHSRIRLQNQAFTTYGFHMFGQFLELNPDQSDMKTYFYIDSGYMKTLFSYGILFAVLAVLVYVLIFRAAVKAGDRIMASMMLCMAFYNVFNNLMMTAISNCTFLAVWYAVRVLRDRRDEPLLKGQGNG